MSKNISEEKLVRHFNEIAEFQLPSEAVRRDLADIRKLLSDQEIPESPAGTNVWRKIMKNKTTRYVAAAMIFFAVLIAMQFLPESELSAAQLLTKVSKNMRQFSIVRSVTENYLLEQDEPTDYETHIIDYSRKQAFIVYSEGYLHQLDYETMVWSIYRPEDNTMIVKPLKGEWLNPDAQIDEYIKKLSQEGLEVRQSELLEEGVKLTVIEYDEMLNNISVEPDKYMSKMMMGNKTVKRIHTKLTVNRNELYLSRSEISYYDPQDKLIVTKKSTSEPTETSPEDIYELGVPADVTIIDKVPDERVKEVRELIKKSQSEFLKDYVAIQLENRLELDGTETLIEGMVIYSQGKKLRVDVFGRRYPSDDDKAKLDQVEALMTDSKIRIQPYMSQEFSPRAIRIYDGLWQHNLDDYSGQFVVRSPQRRPDGDEYGDDDIDDFGWRVLWMYTEPEWMYEDDFSIENDLLAMEVTRQSQWGRLPERKVLYIDPERDYLYRRYIEEKVVDAAWQIDKTWLDSAENKDRLEEEVRVYDVVDYAQTSQGQWYPKTVTIKGYRYPLRKYSVKVDINRISRIYLLEENPDLPDALFDPKQLSILKNELE